MKRAFPLFFALFFLKTGFVQAQDTVRIGKPYGQVFAIEMAGAKQICGDALLNAFILNDEGQVFAIDDRGAVTGRYSNDKLGNPARIDASQGSLTVWHKDFNTVVWLSPSMTETARLDMAKEANILTATIVAPASDGNLWVYDETAFQLKKIDRQTGRLLVSSPNLSSVLKAPLKPFALQEHNSQVFLGDPQAGILIFDGLGQYARTMPEKGLSPFFISDNKLNFVSDGFIETIHARFISQRRDLALPEGLSSEAHSFFINKKRLYCITPTGIEAWVYGLPPSGK